MSRPMALLTHRDMTGQERDRVECAAHVESTVGPAWSSHTVAVMILLSGSFVVGLLLFGLPAAFLVGESAESHVRDAVLFVPGLLTLLLGGSWAVLYYERGEWRVRPELLDDLDYGRVEVLQATVGDAWALDGGGGTTWLLDVGEEVLLLAPSVVPAATPRTFPGRQLHLVRCKHSGLVLGLDLVGLPLTPTGCVRVEELTSMESARLEGGLEEACRRAVLTS
jgi:hypothetical protein